MIDWDKYPTPDRIRHHLSANNYFPKKDLKIEPENYPPVYESINWSEHFTNGKSPKLLDIGCGFGWFSMDYSTTISENILGIEVRSKAVNYALDVKNKEKLDNCSFLWYSVVNGLQFIEENSIKKVFYFFPDPWFKKKHRKRRAFDLDFLKFCYRVIENGGELRLQTDILEVHEYHLENLAEFGKFDYKVIEDDNMWNLPATNKEKDCLKNGYEYYRIIATKNV